MTSIFETKALATNLSATKDFATRTFATNVAATKTFATTVFEQVSGVYKCPACKSMDLIRTDASGVVLDAYKCCQCEHEFTALGPTAKKAAIRYGLKAALVVGSLIVGAVPNI